jgi:predicted CopG family antitoxin
LYSTTSVHNFVSDLALARKNFKEIKAMVDSACGDKTLKKTDIYAILKKVKAGENSADLRHLNLKKRTRISAVISAVATIMEEEQRTTIKNIALANGVSVKIVGYILQRPWARSEVHEVGATAFEFGAETGEDADMPEVFGSRPAGVSGHIGQYKHH